MPITQRDWIPGVVDESLTEAGIAYACHSLCRPSSHQNRLTIPQLRAVVAQTSVELSFRRWLHSKGLPYRLFHDHPFTRPEKPSLILGGRRVELNCLHLSSRTQIQRFCRNPEVLLAANAIHSTEHLTNSYLSESALIIFAIYLGLETHTLSDLRTIQKENPASFLIVVPQFNHWCAAGENSSLGKIGVSIQDPEESAIEISGWVKGHQVCREHIPLDRKTSQVKQAFDSLIYLSTKRLPASDIRLYSPVQKKEWRIRPGSWKNLWIYGSKIYFSYFL